MLRRFSALLVLMLCIGAQSAFSEDPPIKLFGVPDTTGGKVSIMLHWQNNTAGKADTFSVHRAVFAPGVLPSGVPPKYVDVLKDSSFTDAIDKVAGYTYVYTVKARTGVLPLPVSNTVVITFPNIIVTPPSLSASVGDSGKVNLQWTAPINFTLQKYVIYRGPNVNGAPFSAAVIDTVSGSAVKYTDKVAPGSYGYYIRAINGASGVNSNLAFVNIEVKNEPVVLTGILDSAKNAQLKWTVPSNGSVDKYFVYRAYTNAATPAFASASFVLYDSTNVPAYTDLKVKQAAGWYGYVVRTVTSTNVPVQSNIVLLKNETSVRVDNFVLSAAPVAGGVKLAWALPSGYASAKLYIKRLGKGSLEQSTDRKNFVIIDSVAGSEMSYTDDLKNGASPVYSYYIEGTTAGGQLFQSVIANVVLTENIVLSLLPASDGALKLTWTKPVSGPSVMSYIYRNVKRLASGNLDSTGWVLVDSTKSFDWKQYAKDLGTVTLVGFRVAVKMEAGPLFASNAVVVAVKPSTPEPFTLTGRADKNTMKLQWNPSPLAQTDQYFIYQAKPASLLFDSTLVFTLIDSTKERSWEHSVAAAGADRFFAFSVEARGNGEKARTNAVLLIVKKDETVDVVKIVSEPTADAVVGQLYTYQAKAVSSDSTAVFTWYRGQPVIPGLTLDSTGKILWTPNAAGWFSTYIGVKSSKGGFASQRIEIRVTAAKVAKGAMHGTVTDSLGNPIARVSIRIYQRSSTPVEYGTVTDSLGNFSFASIAAGEYKAFASPLLGNFLPVWYPNARSADQAEKIVVAESSDVAVPFVLPSRELSIPKFSLSGFVTDSAGAPIPGAAVIFARAEFILNAAKSIADSGASMNYRQLFAIAFQSGLADLFRFDGLNREIVRAFTDSTGKYSMMLPKGAYVGIAFAQGYRRLLYNNKTDLLSADLLRLTTDTTNINFAMQAKPVNVILGGISGQVKDSLSGAGVPSRVIAYRNLLDNRIADAYYVDTDSNGVYTVSELPAGKYIVLAVPLGTYAPSFYSSLGTTLKWKNASKIDINGALLAGLDIFVKPFNHHDQGLTAVHGTVVTPLGPGNSTGAMTLQGVNGSIVSVSDANGTVVGYAVTDENGQYSIDGLAPGTYTVSADRFGYTSTSTVNVAPAYDAQGNPVTASASFTINNDAPLSVAQGTTVSVPGEYRLDQNFPNPFNPSTTIRFALPVTVRATVAVYNILGQKVATLMDGVMQAGTYNLVWNAGNMASGIYFYQVRTDAFTATKKMMLLK